MNVSPFDPGVLPLAALLLFRVGAMLLIAPTFSSRAVPMQWRVACTLLLVWLLLPTAVAYSESVPRITAAAIAGELLIGFGLGLGAALLAGAAEAAGDIIAIQTGVSGASTLDPVGSTTTPVVGQLLHLIAVLLLLIGGGHVAMLAALGDSLVLLPPGEPLIPAEGLRALLMNGAIILALGLRFAAPVILVVFLSNAALGVLARTAPRLNVFMLAYPLQIGLGLLTLGITLPFALQLADGWDGAYVSLTRQFLEAVRP